MATPSPDDEVLIQRIARQLGIRADSDWTTDGIPEEHQDLCDFALDHLNLARANGWDERYTTLIVATIAAGYRRQREAI